MFSHWVFLFFSMELGYSKNDQFGKTHHDLFLQRQLVDRTANPLNVLHGRLPDVTNHLP